MVLTVGEIKTRKLVNAEDGVGFRDTTYDATVGTFVAEGKEIQGEEFHLPPRGVVWVISAEVFTMPCDLTGIATLKTGWTHDGVLALNVGVVDPGWSGPLGTAVVNFGNSDFVIRKGQPFLRLLFHPHDAVDCKVVAKTMEEYVRQIKTQSKSLSSTFLNMNSLTAEVSNQIFRMPRSALYVAIIALFVAVISIFMPIAFNVWTDYNSLKAEVAEIRGAVGLEPTPVENGDETAVEAGGNSNASRETAIAGSAATN